MFQKIKQIGFLSVFLIICVIISRNSFGQPEKSKAVAPIEAMAPLEVEKTEGEEKTSESDDDEELEKKEKSNPYFENLVSPDRSLLRRYDQALRLIQADRIAEAAQLLGAVLENSADFLTPPPVSGNEEANDPKAKEELRTIRKTFADQILEKLQGLPSKGKESYLLQFETQAKRLLEKAVEQGSLEGLQRVARNYFPTSSGGLATLLIGLDQFEKGDREAAMSTLNRLETVKPRQQSDLLSYEPALSLTLASCQLHAKNENEARKTLDRFLKRFPDPEILLSGKIPWKPKSIDEILNELNRSLNASEPISTADWMEQNGWRLSWGNAAQNPQTQAKLPLLDSLWSVPSTETSFITPQINLLLKHVQQAEEAYIPALQPILIDQILVLRGLGSTTGVDIKSGKRLWCVRDPELQIRHGIQAPYIRLPFHQMLAMPNAQYQQFGLRMFFWHDRLSHQMSSDGRQFFFVEGLDPMPMTLFGPWGGARRPIMIGNKRAEDPRYQPGSTLTARDVKTGRILWQIGKFPYAQKVFDRLGTEYEEFVLNKRQKDKSKDIEKTNENDKTQKDETETEKNDGFSDEELFLSETWFHGAPLPLQGRLYVIGENTNILRLIVLDAQTGKLLSQQPLVQSQTPFETDWLRRYYGLTPASSGGIVVCQSALGMIVALDAGTLSPRWAFSYVALKDEADENIRNQFQNAQFFQYERNGSNDEFRRIFEKTGWQVPCTIIDSNRVLVAPPDSPALYCLDLATGELLWKNEEFDRLNALYVACIRNGSAYIVTPISMISLSMENGRPNWEFVLKETDSQAKKTDPNIPSALRVIKKDLLETAAKDEKPHLEPIPEETGLKKLVFPKPLKPTGVGILGGKRYFLPFSDACLGMIDLDRGTMKLISTNQALEQNDASDLPEEQAGQNMSSDIETKMISSDLSPRLSLGNLIGIQGKFYSQSPDSLLCFDQWESLKKATDKAQIEKPDSPETFIQIGRVQYAQGNLAEAIAAFQKAQNIQPSELAADYLRKTLLNAVQKDYPTWNSSAKDLENLAEFPEELGEILFALSQGAIRQGHSEEFADLLKKVLRLELDHSVGISAETGLTLQLHRALGGLIEQNRKGTLSDEQIAFNKKLEQVAETLFDRFASRQRLEEFLPRPRFYETSQWMTQQLLSQPWWEQDSLTSLGDIRRWRLFNELFGSLSIAERSRKVLQDQYEKNRLFVSLEMLLNPPNDRELPAPADDKQTISSSLGSTDSVQKQPVPEPFRRQSFRPGQKALEHLAGVLESKENIADAYRYYDMIDRLYGKEGEMVYRKSLDKPEIAVFYRNEIQNRAWPNGDTRFFDGESNPDMPTAEQDNPYGKSIARILQQVRSRNRSVANQVSVPYLGAFEPFLSPYRYAMEASYPNSAALICYDGLGEERWRYNLSLLLPDLSDYGYFSDNNVHYRQGFVPQQVYIKGCNHLLLFVRGNMLVALDVFGAGPTENPKLLWSKKLTTSFPARQMFSAMPLHRLLASGQQGPWAFPTEPLFVSSRIVCFRDGDNIYGIDPSTGQTIWSRSCNSSVCSFFGDRESLFCVFPETRIVSAIAPENGYVLSEGRIPDGVVFSYETKLVFLAQHISQTGPSRNTIQIAFVDLRDLFELAPSPTSNGRQGQKHSVVSAVSDPQNTQNSNQTITLPAYMIRDGLLNNSQIRAVLDNQVLAILSWESKTLQLYDLGNQKDLLGPTDDSKRRLGVKLSLEHLKDVKPYDCDLDVELYDGKYLVQFVDIRRVDTAPKNLVEDGVSFQRHCNVVSNVASRSVGSGTIMLYAPDGSPCWKEPAKIKDWFRVQNTPSQSPVVLFALSVTDQEKNQSPHDLTALLGIDKETGKTRFSKLIPSDKEQKHALLQGFRVAVIPENNEMVFSSPYRTVHAKFTGDPAPIESPKVKPKAPTTLKEHIETNWFNWFPNGNF